MTKKTMTLIIGAVLIIVLIILSSDRMNTIFSPYSGQETRTIKSLSEIDIESLINGTGVAFGGMAKPAELNGYPGPSHVLAMAEKINLSPEQIRETEAEFKRMNTLAIEVGAELIALEREIDNAFLDKNITTESLSSLLDQSADKYSELRNIHLSSHLVMVNTLSKEQIQVYNKLRGYEIN